ncbi:MAG TPA: glycosyltransferase family 39 protein [Thermoanaerobaculia bacterium]|nr:glycosyltransferase family 39 protein [Thermoanaerobaculia bacterium]
MAHAPSSPFPGDAAPPLARPWLGLAWMLVAAAAMSFHLGGSPLVDPDEGRPAEIAREMARSGDFILPRFNGLPSLDKPVLFPAAQALVMRAIGPSELAARLPSLLCAWGTVALTAWFAATLFGRESAWIAGTVAATAPLALAMARTGRSDSMLSFLVLVALVGFYQAVEADPAEGFPGWGRWTLLAWAAMAAGVVTKGPVALALPLLVAAPYALWRRRSLAVWHPAGWGLHLLIVLPWILAVEHRAPGFLRYALLTETWRRATTDELDRTGPAWYFLPYLLAGFFPWLLVVAGAGRRRARRWLEDPDRSVVLLLLWLALPLACFSLFQSKRPQYLLPLVPAVALLAARAWSRPRLPIRGARAGAAAWLVLGCTLLAAAAVSTLWTLPASLAGLARSTSAALGLAGLASGALAWIWAGRRTLAPVALSLPLVLLPLLAGPLMDEIARERSAKDLAAAVRPYLERETEVVGIETFSPSLAFYLGRPIRVSSSTGLALGSNYVQRHYERLADPDSPFLCPPECWQESLRTCAQPTIFLLKPRRETERATLAAAGLPLLFEDRRLVAMGPCHAPPGAALAGPALAAR